MGSSPAVGTSPARGQLPPQFASNAPRGRTCRLHCRCYRSYDRFKHIGLCVRRAAIARVDVHAINGVGVRPAHLTGSRDESALPSLEARGVSTVPPLPLLPEGPSFFRGAKPGEAPSFEPRPNDFKVDPATGTDDGNLAHAIDDLQLILGSFILPTASAELLATHGQYFVSVNGFANRRRRGEAGTLDDLLAHLAERLPGSWGLVHDRDDGLVDSPGPNAFRVRVLARGIVTEREDHFLSSCRPIIEN